MKGKAPKNPLNPVEVCEKCGKTPELCICSTLEELKTQTSVLILQHPQEPDKDLGTAKIAQLSLKNSKLKVGLSWANLDKAWGEKTNRDHWLVLYLGSADVARLHNIKKPAIALIDKKNKIFSKPENDEYLEHFSTSKRKGIIILDGTWSQAKTIWWRNAWLTKIQRAVVLAPSVSLYGKLRKEPKKESLSTIEAIAYTLAVLDSNKEVPDKLLGHFGTLLKKYKQSKS